MAPKVRGSIEWKPGHTPDLHAPLLGLHMRWILLTMVLVRVQQKDGVHPILGGLTESRDQRKGWIASAQPSISDKDEVARRRTVNPLAGRVPSSGVTAS